MPASRTTAGRKRLPGHDRGTIQLTVRVAVVLFPILWIIFASVAVTQELPREIRGYKVHKATVKVGSDGPKDQGSAEDILTADAGVLVSRPRVADIGLFGVVLEMTAKIFPPKQRGKIDLLAFHGFTANGIPMEFDEYRQPFELSGRSNEPFVLTLRARIRNTDILRAAYRELVDSKDEWRIRGRVFVFGRFKRFGLTFKRVVPVDLDLSFPNPLR